MLGEVVKSVNTDWIQDLYYREFLKPKLKSDEFYWEHGKMVMTEMYHKRRGQCCNSNCKHCPYKNTK